MGAWFAEIIVSLATFPFFLLASLWLHELGHSRTLETFSGYKAPVSKGWRFWHVEIPDPVWEKLTVEEKREVINNGIVGGLLPIVSYGILGLFIPCVAGSLLLMMYYMFAVLDDVAELQRLEG